MLFIDKTTGVYRDAEPLVLIPTSQAENFTKELDEGLSDSEVADIARNAEDLGTGISTREIRRLLEEVRDEKGDWRGTLDYLISILD